MSGRKDGSPLDGLDSVFDDLRQETEEGLREAREEFDAHDGEEELREPSSRASETAPNLGRFEGQVVTRWERDPDGKDRTMTLLEDFVYVDPEGRRWVAAAGRRIDGASIPTPFWNDWLGAPFVGNFRRATVLHDVGCDDKTEPYKAVHRMFYWACRCDEVPQTKALLMYTAVRIGGPRWGEAPRPSATRPSEARLDEIRRSIKASGDEMTLEEVDRMLDSALGE